MAKVSRSVLKEIVKECLVEILSEGLLSSAETLNENKSRKPRQKADRVSADVFQQRNKMLRERTKKEQPAVNVDHITEDPMMREIFADTAATTLREQPLSEGSSAKTDYVPGDAAAKAVFDNELEDLFEGAGNWAALAFNDAKK